MLQQKIDNYTAPLLAGYRRGDCISKTRRCTLSAKRDRKRVRWEADIEFVYTGKEWTIPGWDPIWNEANRGQYEYIHCTLIVDGELILKADHVIVWEKFHQAVRPHDHSIHHIDTDRINNIPSNLLLLTVSDHNAYHRYLDPYKGTPEYEEMRVQLLEDLLSGQLEKKIEGALGQLQDFVRLFVKRGDGRLDGRGVQKEARAVLEEQTGRHFDTGIFSMIVAGKRAVPAWLSHALPSLLEKNAWRRQEEVQIPEEVLLLRELKNELCGQRGAIAPLVAFISARKPICGGSLFGYLNCTRPMPAWLKDLVSEISAEKKAA